MQEVTELVSSLPEVQLRAFALKYLARLGKTHSVSINICLPAFFFSFSLLLFQAHTPCLHRCYGITVLRSLQQGQTRHGSIRHTGSGGTDKAFDFERSTVGLNFGGWWWWWWWWGGVLV